MTTLEHLCALYRMHPYAVQLVTVGCIYGALFLTAHTLSLIVLPVVRRRKQARAHEENAERLAAVMQARATQHHCRRQDEYVQ